MIHWTKLFDCVLNPGQTSLLQPRSGGASVRFSMLEMVYISVLPSEKSADTNVGLTQSDLILCQHCGCFSDKAVLGYFPGSSWHFCPYILLFHNIVCLLEYLKNQWIWFQPKNNPASVFFLKKNILPFSRNQLQQTKFQFNIMLT